MCCPRLCARLRPPAVRVRIRSRSASAKRQAATRQSSTPGAGGGIGSRFREWSELCLSIDNALNNAEQVKGATRQPVDPRHRHHVAGASLPSIRLISRRSGRAKM